MKSAAEEDACKVHAFKFKIVKPALNEIFKLKIKMMINLIFTSNLKLHVKFNHD